MNSFFPIVPTSSSSPMKSTKSVNNTITRKINAVKDSAKSAAGYGSSFSYMKSNYQEWLKYGVFFFLVGYAVIIVVGLFGLPPDTLHNMFSFLTGFLDYFRLDYTSIGKPPQSDSEVEEGKGIQMYRR